MAQAELKTIHVRTGDNVKILAGKDRGKTGKVTAVSFESGRVVVDGANIVIKHQKARSQQQQSTRDKRPGSIDSSNVQIVCPSCNKPTRVGKKAVEVKGKEKFVRICKKCTAVLDTKQDKKADKKAKKSKATEETAAATEEKAKKTTTSKKAATEKAPKGGDGVKEKNAD